MKFTSFLNPLLKSQLEEMFFFNPRQADYREEIAHAVELFGDPKIKESLNGLTVFLPKVTHAQCLFAVDCEGSKLGCVVIFTREEAEELEILHIAICRDWQVSSTLEAGLGSLISEMTRIAKRICGVKKLRLPYGRGFLRVKN